MDLKLISAVSKGGHKLLGIDQCLQIALLISGIFDFFGMLQDLLWF